MIWYSPSTCSFISQSSPGPNPHDVMWRYSWPQCDVINGPEAVMWRHAAPSSDITSFTLASCVVLYSYDLTAHHVTSFITRGEPYMDPIVINHEWNEGMMQLHYSSWHPAETSVHCFLLKRSRLTWLDVMSGRSWLLSWPVGTYGTARNWFVISYCTGRHKWSVSDVILRQYDVMHPWPRSLRLFLNLARRPEGEGPMRGLCARRAKAQKSISLTGTKDRYSYK
jgi:hypothetical protein